MYLGHGTRYCKSENDKATMRAKGRMHLPNTMVSKTATDQLALFLIGLFRPKSTSVLNEKSNLPPLYIIEFKIMKCSTKGIFILEIEYW